MARLNEVPAAPDSGETLRKRLFRQNRDLARSNNVRALRIKELENNCACMLSENLELRARIVGLERQLEDSEARRIADHALAIKARIEAQLEEWGGLIAGLGLEPPMKRLTPETRRSTARRRTSFIACRPSPSQRRLRDIAREVEDLGYISENKTGPRRSMNPEQILALRSEADISIDSMELGPPPVSHYLEGDRPDTHQPEDINSHARDTSPELSFGDALEDKIPSSPVQFASPGAVHEDDDRDPPETASDIVHPASIPIEAETLLHDLPELPILSPPPKFGSKRKLAAAAATDDVDESQAKRVLCESNTGSRPLVEKVSARQKTVSRTPLKDLPASKNELGEKEGSAIGTRRPLANKSTNDDVVGSSHSQKFSKTIKASVIDDGQMRKDHPQKSRPVKAKAKKIDTALVEPQVIMVPEAQPTAPAPEVCDLAAPIVESVLLVPNTPEPATTAETSRGDTPPPADISLTGETSRPSRRSMATISYAEPNLRDKMRRPTKALVDAVPGNGGSAMRARRSGASLAVSLQAEVRPEPALEASTPGSPTAKTPALVPQQAESGPASPGADSEPPMEDLPASVVTERRRRPTSVVAKEIAAPAEEGPREEDNDNDDADKTGEMSGSDLSDVKEADVYEFTSSPPRVENAKSQETKRSHRRQTTSSRRSSTAVVGAKDRGNSRRKSMMV